VIIKFSEERIVSLTNGDRTIVKILSKRMKLDPYLTPYTKLTQSEPET
jgi:hypothetical protein